MNKLFYSIKILFTLNVEGWKLVDSLVSPIPHHGVGLPRPSLSICKQRAVVTWRKEFIQKQSIINNYGDNNQFHVFGAKTSWIFIENQHFFRAKWLSFFFLYINLSVELSAQTWRSTVFPNKITFLRFFFKRWKHSSNYSKYFSIFCVYWIESFLRITGQNTRGKIPEDKIPEDKIPQGQNTRGRNTTGQNTRLDYGCVKPTNWHNRIGQPSEVNNGAFHLKLNDDIGSITRPSFN